MDNKELDKSRAEFEAWAREEYGFGDAEFHAPYEGRYLWERTSDMWFAWRAARAGTAAPAAPTTELKYTEVEMAQAHVQGYELGMKQKREALLSEVAPAAAVQPSLPEYWTNDVQTAWRCVRKYNNTIPDASLDLMRDMLLAAATPEQSDTTMEKA